MEPTLAFIFVSRQDIVIALAVIILVVGGQKLADFGKHLGDHFPRGGPGGPKAA